MRVMQRRSFVCVWSWGLFHDGICCCGYLYNFDNRFRLFSIRNAHSNEGLCFLDQKRSALYLHANLRIVYRLQSSYIIIKKMPLTRERKRDKWTVFLWLALCCRRVTTTFFFSRCTYYIDKYTAPCVLYVHGLGLRFPPCFIERFLGKKKERKRVGIDPR